MGCFSIPIARDIKLKQRSSSSSSHSSASSCKKEEEDDDDGMIVCGRSTTTTTTLFPQSPARSVSSRVANTGHNQNNLNVATTTSSIDIGCIAPAFRSISLHSPKSMLLPASLFKTPNHTKQTHHYQQKNACLDQQHSFGHGFHHNNNSNNNNNNNEDEGRSIFHSAPLYSNPAIDMSAHKPGHLFPLPLPPAPNETTVSSTISTKSSSSSSSSSSSIPPSSSSSSSSPHSKASNNRAEEKSSKDHSTDAHIASSLMPLPLPPSTLPTSLREFSFDELAGACLNFAPEFYVRNGGVGPVYRATIRHSSYNSKQKEQEQEQEQEDQEQEQEQEGRAKEEGPPPMEVSVTVLSKSHSLQRFKKWRAEVESLARLNHPNLCKLIGFTREDPSRSTLRDGVATHAQRERLLVFDYAANGSLDTLLYCRKGKAPLDWATRLKIAIGAGEGLAFLHDRMPRQIVYKLFKTLNIQVDHKFNAKLSDYYGFTTKSREEIPSSLNSASSLVDPDDAYVAPETRACGDVTAKSNVWSFGVVLLELLTGRQNMDEMFPEEERNLVQWCRPYLLDPKRLYLVMDPELKGRYPTRAAKTVADLALLCLSEDPRARPSMRNVVGVLSAHHAKSMQYNMSSLLQHHNSANISRSLSCKTKARLSKSYSLASVLTSPGRIFPDTKALDFIQGHHVSSTTQCLPNRQYPIFQGKAKFLSGEMVRRRTSLPPSLCSLSGEIFMNP